MNIYIYVYIYMVESRISWNCLTPMEKSETKALISECGAFVVISELNFHEISRSVSRPQALSFNKKFDC